MVWTQWDRLPHGEPPRSPALNQIVTASGNTLIESHSTGFGIRPFQGRDRPATEALEWGAIRASALRRVTRWALCRAGSNATQDPTNGVCTPLMPMLQSGE
jgi:hypothetical protein